MRIQRILACILALALLAAVPAALAETTIDTFQHYASKPVGGWYYSPVHGWVWFEKPPWEQFIYYPGVGFVPNDTSSPKDWPDVGSGPPRDRPVMTTPRSSPTSHGKSNRGTLTATANAKVYVGPSTNNEVLGNVKSGETLEIISWDITGDWVRVYYNDHNNAGWIQAKYAK